MTTYEAEAAAQRLRDIELWTANLKRLRARRRRASAKLWDMHGVAWLDMDDDPQVIAYWALLAEIESQKIELNNIRQG